VEKDRFNYLVRNFNSLTQQETAELRLEQDHHSYCQVLHQLIARGDQDNLTEMKESSLNIAAVYSTDRSILKSILIEPRQQRVEASAPPVSMQTGSNIPEEAPVPSPPEAEATPINTNQTITQPTTVSDFDTESALSKFIAELGPMREMKLKFEKALEDFDKNQFVQKPKRQTKSAASPKRATSPKRTASPKSISPPSPAVPLSTSDDLLKEIKTSKKKVTPENPKQREQIEIIDQFIKTQPTISKPTGVQAELDLTEVNKSYNDNAVSETLALILIKQGKKDKAVEVLRKLIWKFPQKKAYFAAQIEELTK